MIVFQAWSELERQHDGTWLWAKNGTVGPPYNEDAPKIYWKHHLENAEPMGSA